jgi:predicted nucleotide-binding protein
MTLDELRSFLVQRNVRFQEHEIPYGTSIRCTSGEILNFYPKNGKLTVQGKQTVLSQAVKAWADTGFKPASKPGSTMTGPPETMAAGPDTRVFVVYGHDLQARNALELLLRRMGLNPIVLANLPAAGDTIIEKLEQYLGDHANVGFACVLLTADDEGFRKGKQQEQKYRARQNVILELGMVLSRLGRSRVAILYQESVERPSDIDGLIYIPFREYIEEAKTQLFRELRNAGYNPNTEAL